VHDQEFVQQRQRGPVPLHQRRDVDQRLDQRRVKRVDVAQVLDVATSQQCGQDSGVVVDEAIEDRVQRRGVFAAQDSFFAHMAQLGVVQLELGETFLVVVEVLVDLLVGGQIGEELLDAALSGHERDDGNRPRTIGVVNDRVELVDGAPELARILLAQPKQELVDQQHQCAVAVRLQVLRDPLQAICPLDQQVTGSHLSASETEILGGEHLSVFRQSAGQLVELLLATEDSGPLHLLPEGVAVQLPFAPGLLDDPVDVV